MFARVSGAHSGFRLWHLDSGEQMECYRDTGSEIEHIAISSSLAAAVTATCHCYIWELPHAKLHILGASGRLECPGIGFFSNFSSHTPL